MEQVGKASMWELWRDFSLCTFDFLMWQQPYKIPRPAFSQRFCSYFSETFLFVERARPLLIPLVPLEAERLKVSSFCWNAGADHHRLVVLVKEHESANEKKIRYGLKILVVLIEILRWFNFQPPAEDGGGFFHWVCEFPMRRFAGDAQLLAAVAPKSELRRPGKPNLHPSGDLDLVPIPKNFSSHPPGITIEMRSSLPLSCIRWSILVIRLLLISVLQFVGVFFPVLPRVEQFVEEWHLCQPEGSKSFRKVIRQETHATQNTPQPYVALDSPLPNYLLEFPHIGTEGDSFRLHDSYATHTTKAW